MKKDMKVKVCGLRDAQNILQVAALSVDWIGFDFLPGSPRYMSMIPTHAGIIPDRSSLSHPTLDAEHPTPLRVGVFADEMAQNIITRVVNFQLDFIQLNGHEMPTFIRNLRRTLDPDIRPGIKFMKAITVIKRDDIATYKNYADSVDYFLFDVLQKSTEGKTNWSVLDAYDGEQPFLISGNIGPNDALTIRQSLAINSFPIEKCLGINLDTRFESSPGIKNIELLTHFLEELRH